MEYQKINKKTHGILTIAIKLQLVIFVQGFTEDYTQKYSNWIGNRLARSG